MNQETKGKETQAKFAKDRTAFVENHFGLFCQTFGSMTRKIARMRDKGDLLSKQISQFAGQDKFSHTTAKNLKDFAQNLSAVQDYRDAEIHRLEQKVVKPLSGYGPVCKKVKTAVKKEQQAINKQLKQQKQLEKVKSKSPSDEHSISAAETELNKAKSEANIGSEALNRQILLFEKQKLTDLKRILTDFVSVEMVFHAKAIEFYSKCFENLAMIDEDMDLEEFARRLSLTQGGGFKEAVATQGQLPPEATMSTLGTTCLSTTLGSTSDYTSTGDSYTYTYGTSTAMSNSEKRVRIQTSMYGAEEDDEEETDEEDDDDDDDDNGDMFAARR